MKNKDKFLQEMLSRFEDAEAADNDLRNCALDDVRFAYIPGHQWDETLKAKRKNRPCYEFPKIRQALRQVIGDQRQNRPQIKVRAIDSNTDPQLAETLNGLIRSIESSSNAERAYDTAFEYAIAGGYGAWRVTTDYENDYSFNQELRIEEIRNPFTVYFDPSAQEFDKRDGRFAFVVSEISKDEFKQKYPGKELVDFEASALDSRARSWITEDTVRIAEYWCKKPVTKTLLMLSDGSTAYLEDVESILDELAQPEFQSRVNPGATTRNVHEAMVGPDGMPVIVREPVTVVKQREVETYDIEQYIVSGTDILEGPIKWAGRFIPIVPLWGEVYNIDGRDIYSGLVRPAKDAQRVYNFHRTAMTEAVANAPKAPWVVTPRMIEGFEDWWKNANAQNYPYLPYNPDQGAPNGRPVREAGPDVPAAMITLSQYDSDDIKSATGIYDASLGARSNETSGRAILARQREGDVSTFTYIDNLSRAIKFTGEILVDLIPKIYDTERTIRVLGEDGAESYAVLNEQVYDEQSGQWIIKNDLSQSRFDVTVSVGPSYTTQRMEAADMLMQLSQNPAIAPLVTDLIVKNLDLPGSEEVLERVRKLMIRQGLAEPKNPEEMPQPDPMQEQMQQLQMRQLMADVLGKEAEAQAKAQGTQIDAMEAQAKAAQIMAQIRNLDAKTQGELLENLVRQTYPGPYAGEHRLNL